MLKDRVAIVTGGNRGIGKAIALKLASEKCNVVINYRSDSSKASADETKAELEKMGVKVVIAKGDISKYEDCEAIVKAAVDGLGQVDIVINNAGITKDTLLLRMKPEDFQSVINTNLNGAFYMIKAASKHLLRSKHGRVINISSIIGRMGNKGQANYAASKSGLFGLTKSVAKEFASRSITANCICPGFIQTSMTDSLPKEVVEEYANAIPLGKLGTSEDVANCALFLASDMASYITGQEITVDGGLVM